MYVYMFQYIKGVYCVVYVETYRENNGIFMMDVGNVLLPASITLP